MSRIEKAVKEGNAMKKLYRDAVGNLNSTGIISVFGAQYGNPGTGYLAFSAASDAPYRRWDYISKDVAHIVNEMESDGWICDVGSDGYNAPKITCTHIATQTAIDYEHAISNTKFANAERGFIRFGAPPKTGRSTNYRDNTLEDGVSVFNAEFIGSNYRVLADSILEATYYMVANRPAYRIYGDVVGTGADGEPVVKIMRCVLL